MRLAFFGSGAFGVPTLRALHGAHELAAIVSQPDKPAGRGGRLAPTPVSEWAMAQGLSDRLLRPENVNEPAVIDQLHAIDADGWVVIAYGQKLSNRLLKLGEPDELFVINLHGSRLPAHRGAAPINAAILAGDKTVGNSVITVVEKMDAGEILAQTSRPLDPMTTAGELHDLLSDDGPGAVLGVLERFADGSLERRAQDPALVSHAGKMRKSDGVIDWARPAAEIQRRIHAFNPWPGASTLFGGDLLKLHRAESVDGQSDQDPGALVGARDGVVVCGGGSLLRLLSVQPAGKKAMAFSDFARGRQLEDGARLG